MLQRPCDAIGQARPLPGSLRESSALDARHMLYVQSSRATMSGGRSFAPVSGLTMHPSPLTSTMSLIRSIALIMRKNYAARGGPTGLRH